MTNRIYILTSALASLAACAPMSLVGQHQHDTSPYAATQSLEFPTLTPEEVGQLRGGEGMGLARPAELNHFPGPKHLLELASELQLTAAQVERIGVIRLQMTTQAVAKGEEILRAESHLSDVFAGGRPTLEDVARITTHQAKMRGELQAIHLAAHIESTRELTPEQVSAYDRLRGYVVPNGQP